MINFGLKKTKEGLISVFTFSNSQLSDVEFLPVEINNFGQPNFLKKEKKKKILDELYQLSIERAKQL